jgi:hypothetical protein
MANPQPDVFIKVSKEFLKAKAGFRLSGQQNQFLETLMVLTWGENPPRKFFPYSGKVISEISGLSRRQVYKIKCQLIKMLVINVTQKGDKYKERIGINKDYEQWVASPKKETRHPKRRQLSPKKETILNPTYSRERKKKKRTSEFLESFWPAYPIKKSKKKAQALWESLSTSGKLPELSEILSAIESQKVEKEKLLDAGKFCPEWKHPTTWLYQGCWEDEIISIQERKKTGNSTYSFQQCPHCKTQGDNIEPGKECPYCRKEIPWTKKPKPNSN